MCKFQMNRVLLIDSQGKMCFFLARVIVTDTRSDLKINPISESTANDPPPLDSISSKKDRHFSEKFCFKILQKRAVIFTSARSSKVDIIIVKPVM